jgi:hypothetical protein
MYVNNNAQLILMVINLNRMGLGEGKIASIASGFQHSSV